MVSDFWAELFAVELSVPLVLWFRPWTFWVLIVISFLLITFIWRVPPCVEVEVSPPRAAVFVTRLFSVVPLSTEFKSLRSAEFEHPVLL